MKKRYQFLVIGAGPAGMAAAAQAARCGIEVALIDEQNSPGGQIYRNIGATSEQVSNYLGKDYTRGTQLLNEFLDSGATYIKNASVWNLDESLETGILIEGNSHFIAADCFLLATGAQERPMPIPGWELPGVMTAGAGQILLKSFSMIPKGEVILAGSGPLLLLIAEQYIKAGAKITAIVDTTAKSALVGALYKFPQALAAIDYLIRGLSLMRTVQKAGVPVYKHASDLCANGESSISSLSFNTKKGHQTVSHQIKTSTLLLHQGLIPSLKLPLAAGCAVEWDAPQYGWKACVDEWGQSNNDRLMVAGDCARIIGARAAEIQGRLCGMQAAYKLDKLSHYKRDRQARPLRAALKRHLSIRPFLDLLYAPVAEFQLPDDNTLVCRCEEVYAAQIREAARLGCSGINLVKSFTRCGMGPCQGSQCASTASALIADELNIPIEEVGYLRVRPPLTPVTLGELARIQCPDTD